MSKASSKFLWVTVMVIVIAAAAVLLFRVDSQLEILPDTGSQEISDEWVDPTELYLNGIDGYIVELKSDPLLVKFATTSTNVYLDASVSNYKSNLSSERDLAKSEIENLFKGADIESDGKISKEMSMVFNGFYVKANPDLAKQIAALPIVKRVYPDFRYRINIDESVPMIAADQVWNMKLPGQVCDPNTGIGCINGQGITIGIIDTGVDYTHADLGGCLGTGCKVTGGYDFVNHDNDPMDDHFHGTHVASTAAGDGTVYKGVAPKASIYAYKVISEIGSGSSSDVLLAIEASVDPNQDGDPADRLDVISMSIGGDGTPDDPISNAANVASDNGVVVVAAAGNGGNSYNSIPSPGLAVKAITVAATSKQDLIANFSSRGPFIWQGMSIMKPDVSAPGVAICAARLPGALSENLCDQSDQLHARLNGTSMATPHVSGLVALVRQANPNLNPDQVKMVIKSTTEEVGYSPREVGNGRVDALSAVQFALDPTSNTFVELGPLHTRSGGVMEVKGTVYSDDFKKYTIEVADLDSFSSTPGSGDWNIVYSSEQLPTTNVLGSVNLDELIDAKYVVRVTGQDVSGHNFIDYGYVEVDKTKILFPLDSDIYRKGELLTIETATSTSNPALTFSYGKGFAPTRWVGLSNNQFNTSSLSNGVYTIRIQLTSNGELSEDRVIIFLEDTLRAGWPQTINWVDNPDYPYPISTGAMVPTVADLDLDGKKEILVFANALKPKLIVYKHDGSILWQKEIGDISIANEERSLLLVNDLNNDNKPEIILGIPTDRENEKSGLFIFDANGDAYPGWAQPLEFEGTSRIGLMIDKSIHPQIIVSAFGSIGNFGSISLKRVALVKLDKSITTSIPVNYRFNYSRGNDIPRNMTTIGNFDGDSQLELLISGTLADIPDTTLLAAYDLDGSLVNGWPKEFASGAMSSSPVVADIERDGTNEIIFVTSQLNVLDHQGDMKNGWPQLTNNNFQFDAIVADMDKNDSGKMEIAVVTSSANPQIFLFNHDGSLMSAQGINAAVWGDMLTAQRTTTNRGTAQQLVAPVASDYTQIRFSSKIVAYDNNGNSIVSFERPMQRFAGVVIMMEDLDGDGKKELIATNASDYNYKESRSIERSSIYVWNTQDPVSASASEWLQYRFVTGRTGYRSN